MKNTAIRGRYRPENPEKYNGNINRITYRSLWERRFMLYCDRSDQIFKWSSEELHIPYYYEGDDRWHNYYPDFVVELAVKDNDFLTEPVAGRTILVEIKPSFQCKWKQNQAKWAAARKYCEEHGYEFRVLTEKELF